MKVINEKTLIPIGLVGLVMAGAIAWGNIRAEVSSHSERLNKQEEKNAQAEQALNGMRNDLMAQIMILRQDVSEIKGEIKNRRQ